MIKHIFKFELEYWLNRWQFYVYIAIAFFSAYFTLVASGGLFDSGTATVTSATWINSPSSIYALIFSFTSFLYFFLPAIIGTSISKDFSTGTHQVLYSYPINKFDYFVGKFSGALLVTLVVFLFVGLGMLAGVFTPGLNPELMGPNSLSPYLKTYVAYIIPNLLIFGALVFIIVSVTRNVTLGYIFIIILLFQDTLTEQIFDEMDNKYWGAILDPFGFRAHMYYAEYWTVDEQNNNPLPMGTYVWLNRAFWSALGFILLSLFYRKFKLSQTAVTLFKKSGDQKEIMDTHRHGRPLLDVRLPQVNFSEQLGFQLRNIFNFAWMHLKYIVSNTAFIVFALLGVVFLLVLLAFSGQILNTTTLPLTEQILNYGNVTYLFILILTFLFSGFLIHRERELKINQLVDVTPAKNGIHLAAKFLAILGMQAILLSLIMFAGIGYQVYQQFFDINLGLYVFDLLGIRIWYFIPWAAMAFLMHHLIPNKYVGFIVLLGMFIGLPFLREIGIEQSQFIFNRGGTSVNYSSMDGYGSRFKSFAFFRTYWMFLGIALLFLSALLWRRGFSFSFAEKLSRFKRQNTPYISGGLIASLIAFFVMGLMIYRENNVANTFRSSKEREELSVEWEKKYKHFENTNLPRVTDVNVQLNLVPEDQTFTAGGQYIVKNKSKNPVDTLVLNYAGHEYEFDWSRPNRLVSADEVHNFSVYKLQEPLLPGDSMLLDFTINSKPNTTFRINSGVQKNGTFINSSIFPQLSYTAQGELTDDKVRKKYDLPPKERMSPPTDSAALQNTYITSDSDWINFETTVSTSPDQIAIAPGYLQREWEEKGRRFFHYKMDAKMLHFYSYISARYSVKQDKWKDVNLEIYYHKDHDYNLDRMMKGLKRGMDYFTTNFSPYQHRQVRIIEFPNYYGGFAQSFANTIPYSEAVGFIAMVDDSEEGGLDYPFSITAHELAHQWWAHQVIGGNVQGATMLSESLSEYSSLKVLEKEYGKDKMRIFLKDALDKYLMGRTTEQKKEKPLMYNENQPYIHYNKGSLVLYAMSDYLGEEKFNKILKEYIGKVAFQEAPFTTSVELVELLSAATPDSLKYLIGDMFENITLYTNRVKSGSVEKQENGQYKVSLAYEARKYRTDEKGKRVYQDETGNTHYEIDSAGDTIRSLPLADYIEIGVFGAEEGELYLRKHKIDQIFGQIEIIVDELPEEVGIDPYNKLIDTQGDDNRKKL